MSDAEDDAAEPQWRRPPDEECEPVEYSTTPSGANSDEMRLFIREQRDRFGWALVEFAVILQAFHRGNWATVASIDSCHDVDAHLHRYSRTTGERVGGPEVMMEIATLDQVQEACDSALGYIQDNWAALRERWQYA